MDTILSILADRRFWIAATIGLILYSIYLVGFRWRPPTQVRLHQMDLIHAVENNNGRDLGNLISDSYSDQWGYTKKDLQLGFKEMRRGFLALELQPSEVEVNVEKVEGTFSAVIKLQGSGVWADQIKGVLNKVNTPFVFTWRKEGGRPWDWKLISISNEELDLRGYRPGQFDNF